MRAADEIELRRKTADLVLDWYTDGEPEKLDNATTADYVQLVEAAHVVDDESGHALQRWVDAGRRAGLSWADIGDAFGISRQAAQQRFSGRAATTPAVPSPDDESILVRTGVTAFNEVEILREEGDAGREIVGATFFKSFFRQTDHRCENLRVVSLMRARTKEQYEQEGWTHVLNWPPFNYFTRPAE